MIFSRTGPSAWRDCVTPKDILEAFCTRHNLAGPLYTGINTVKVGTRVYNLTDFGKVPPVFLIFPIFNLF